MSGSSPSVTISTTAAPLSAVDAELLVVPWFQGEAFASFLGDLDAATGAELSRAVESGEFAAGPCDLFVTPLTDRTWRARRVMLVGAGPREAFAPNLARQVASASGLVARQRNVQNLAFLMRRGDSTADVIVDTALAQAVAEGLTLAEFSAGSHKTSDPGVGRFAHALVVTTELVGGNAATVAAAVARGRVLGEATNLARSLANEPGNVLTPREFAARVSTMAAGVGVGVEVLDESRIAALGMGLLQGVARGSEEPPRVVVLRHAPRDAPDAPVLGLVGKGVTFDTGGISIKPAGGMERMKSDMAGGAAVACAMHALARLNAPVRVIAVVPVAENMPGGRAIKPGDILRSAEGKTVEVINTDAEGRLILGDGLWYARQLGATHLVDVATLTGAVVVALGKSTSGLFGSPDSWVEHIRTVASACGDRAWPLPLFDDYREQLKSDIADILNTGGRPAGPITAAMFLKEFTGGLPWAHLDIAGTAWAEDAKPYQSKGPTGVGVRTLAELAFTSGAW